MAVFSKTHGSPKLKAHHGKHSSPLALSIRLESPPIMLYGAPQDLSGSLVSGLLFLEVNPTKKIKLENVSLSLTQTVHYSKPFIIPSTSVAACSDCTTKKTVLARWDALTSTTEFSPGRHAYPFSHLLPGSLPASCKLGSHMTSLYIKYELVAEAVGRNIKHTKVVLPLDITRSILRGPDRNSLRVFPPTEVTASAVLPSVIYPKLQFPIELKLDNVVSSKMDKRWRMRKLVWRLEERTKVRASTCQKHESKLRQTEESQRKIRSKSPPKSNAGLHHSTIQTGMLIIPDNESQPHELDAGTDGVEQEVEAPENDTTETERSRPIHVHETFVEDFLRDVSPTPAPTITPAASNTSIQPSPTNSTTQLYLEEVRTVSHGEIKTGWKSDFSGRGKIELVADINLINFLTGVHNHIANASSDNHKSHEDDQGPIKGANVACDVEDPQLGIYVSHTLIVEVVVAEELILNERKRRTPGLEPVPSNSSTASAASTTNLAPTTSTGGSTALSSLSAGVPTGAARVLRMQFKLPLVERSGLGIAWDDEVPPTYEDVRSLSPPHYTESPSSISLVLQTPTVINGIGLTPLEPRMSRGLTSEIQDLTL